MKKKNISGGKPMSNKEFKNLIIEGEKGTFSPIGTFDEFKNEVLAILSSRKKIK